MNFENIEVAKNERFIKNIELSAKDLKGIKDKFGKMFFSW